MALIAIDNVARKCVINIFLIHIFFSVISPVWRIQVTWISFRTGTDVHYKFLVEYHIWEIAQFPHLIPVPFLLSALSEHMCIEN